MARALDGYAKRHPRRVWVFHSLKLPHRKFDIDHIVLTGSTLFLIDTKNWRRGTYRVIDEDGQWRAQYRDRVSGEWFYTQGGGRINLDRYRDILIENLGPLSSDITIVPLLVIAGEVHIEAPYNAPFHALPLSRLSRTLTRLSVDGHVSRVLVKRLERWTYRPRKRRKKTA